MIKFQESFYILTSQFFRGYFSSER